MKDISLLPMLGPYRACLVEAVTRWPSGLKRQFLTEKKIRRKIRIFSGDFTKKKKIQKNVDLPERGFEPQVFNNFPAHDLNFHGK